MEVSCSCSLETSPKIYIQSAIRTGVKTLTPSKSTIKKVEIKFNQMLLFKQFLHLQEPQRAKTNLFKTKAPVNYLNAYFSMIGSSLRFLFLSPTLRQKYQSHMLQLKSFSAGSPRQPSRLVMWVAGKGMRRPPSAHFLSCSSS